MRLRSEAPRHRYQQSVDQQQEERPSHPSLARFVVFPKLRFFLFSRINGGSVPEARATHFGSTLLTTPFELRALGVSTVLRILRSIEWCIQSE